MKDQEALKSVDKGTVLTMVGAAIMTLLTATKIIPFSNLAGYAVPVGIAFFFIAEAVSKTPRSASGLRFTTIPEDLKKPGVLAWAFVPCLTGLATLVIGSLLFGGAFVDHVLGRVGGFLSFDQILLLLIQFGIAAFGEEIALRGFLFGKTAKRYPAWICALVSSAVFAVGHIAPGDVGMVAWDIFGVFIDSLVFSVVYYKSNNCAVSTLSHALANMVSFVAMVCFFQ